MEQGPADIKKLFQQEFTKMVAVLANRFGLQHLALAEDLVSDTFLLATENWARLGPPENPTAWLYLVAKQKALHYFRRAGTFERLQPELAARLERHQEPADLSFSEQNIRDSQLQMLFAVCTPAITSEAQMGLALRILCGFGIDEIAEAFLSNKETINKRLFRAREKLRADRITMALPAGPEVANRLDRVLRIIYLLFNEGYYSRTQNPILRKDLCLEALRLGQLLTEYEPTNRPTTNALMALMCFHASRFEARETIDASVVLYEQQNEDLWHTELVRQGQFFLHRSAQDAEVSAYHLEARIAYWHCSKDDTPEKWEAILQLYNQLLLLNYSPSAALNRTFALYKANGRQAALAEAEKLQLTGSHFYFVLLGELYKGLDQDKARACLLQAKALAKTASEKAGIQAQLDCFT
jgi:RNA polymerase sigma factor (sigma-70 family)